MTVSRLATKPNIENMPHMLRALADRVEAGDETGLNRIAVILNGDGLAIEVYGQQCNGAELVGLLEYTKTLLLFPDE